MPPPQKEDPMTFTEKSARLHAAEKEHASFAAFRRYSAPVWKSGALTSAQKHLLAIAIAQLTGCEFCIENHSRQARTAGAHLDNALDAGFVVSALLATRHLSVDEVVSALGQEPSTGAAAGPAASEHARELTLLVDRVLHSSLEPRIGLLVYSLAADSAATEQFASAVERFTYERGVSVAEKDEATAVMRTMIAGSVYGHSAPVFTAFDA